MKAPGDGLANVALLPVFILGVRELKEAGFPVTLCKRLLLQTNFHFPLFHLSIP